MTTRHVLKFLFSSKYAAWTMVLLLAQQVIVASSTYWLACLAAAASAGQPIGAYGALYGFSLILPYLPGILSLVCISLWDLDLQKKFMDRFISRNQGQIALWRNHSERTRRTSLLSKEGPQALQESAMYFYEVLSTGLNILLNTVVVSFVIHPIFAVGYAVSLALCAALLWISRNKNESLAIEAQGSSVRFTGIMLRIWDNVLLANNFNLRQWLENADSSFAAARRDRLKSVNFTQAMSGVTTLIAMLPIAAAVIWFLTTHPSRSSATAAMLITIPRLFVVLTVTFRLLSLSFGWVSHIARVKALFDGVDKQIPSGADLHSQINFNKISAQTNGGSTRAVDLSSLEELLCRPGRHTIRGENGAGKTALLLKLKERLSSRAAYIPAHHDLDVGGITSAQSTGQRARSVLTEIFHNDPSPVILLDEWDANLDAINRDKLSEQIDRESRGRCIVEVIHG